MSDDIQGRVAALTGADYLGRTQTGIVAVCFWAPWCQPCRVFNPIYEVASRAVTDVAFCTVDADAEPYLMAAHEILAVPTVLVYREGLEVVRIVGALPLHSLQRRIEGARTVDLERVRLEQAGRRLLVDERS